jgi:hypothetical protein
MTLLTSLRSITLPPKLETKTITDPWNGSDNITNHELWQVIRSIGCVKAINKLEDWDDYHLSTKRGPAGQAILTSISEVTLLSPKLIADISLLGGSKLAEEIISLTDKLDILQWRSISWFWNTIYKLKSDNLRKLSFFSDKEGKTRVIGIVDYWTQSSLRPLHKYLNNILKRIPNDMTFNQNNFTTNPLSIGDNCYHSIDLSAATDRMPILLQKRILALLIGQKRADGWHRLLVDTPFLATPSKKEKLLISYNTGQPMGAYSSWPAMALTHHFIVRISALRAGLTSDFSQYYLLGDDLVIGNDLVANEYKKLISSLGMPYSPEKTHTSKDVFEFAKRWFYKGNEITGFSISGLLSVYKRYPLLHNFLSNQASHSWILPIQQHPSLIRNIMRCMNSKYFIINKVESSIKLYLIFDSLISWKHGNKSQEVYEEFYSRISNIAPAQTFKESFPTLQLSFKTLLLNCKFMMVEADLYKFQNDAFKCNDTLYGFVDKYIQGLGNQPETLKSFIRETLSVMLNWNNPIVRTLNRLIDKSIDYLTKTVLSTPDELVPALVIEQGLSKYFVSHGVFSMRSSHSIALAESAVVKCMIKYLKEYNSGKPVNYLVKDPSSLISTANPGMEYMESGMIPALLFRRMAPYLIKAPIYRFIVRGIIKRVFFLSGSTFILGVITYIKGLPAVVLLITTIWTALQTCFLMDPSGLTSSYTNIFGYIGLILLHMVEMYIACTIVACCYHYTVSYEIIVHYFDLYWNQGVITLVDLIISYTAAAHTILMDVQSNILPISSHIITTVGSMSIVPLGFSLMFGSWLLIAFIRWFIGF